MSRGRPVIDMSGKTFGYLTVLGRAGSNEWGNATWDCRCECGNAVVVRGTDLRDADRTSCGHACPKHRHTGHAGGPNGRRTPTYTSWLRMRDRCGNPKHHNYPRYGGRGIKCCDAWQDDHQFLTDLGERPDGHTLSRADHDGNYEPSNCQWAPAGTH